MKKTVLIVCALFFSLYGQTLYAAEQSLPTEGRFSPVPQIMGGYEAASGDWPWMTAILYAGESDMWKAQYCGGVLIAPTWVLTAGHCVEGQSAGDMQVAVGAYDLKNWSGTRIPVKRIVKHPAYNNQSFVNDIALLELNTASGQQSIAIFSGASMQGIDAKLLGQMTTLIGWGLADTPTTWYWPEKLRQINLPVVADSYCNNAFAVTLQSSQFCAGYAAAKDACSGDSGGPMMLMVDGRWVHVGLVSYGAGCQEQNGYYGAYTRSSAYVDFIKQYVPTAQFTSAMVPPVAAPKSLPWLMLLQHKK